MWQRIRWPASTSTQRRLGLLADRAELPRAARVEDAAGRRRGGARDVAFEPDPLASAAVDRRHRREQRLGVRVVRPLEHDLRRAELHQPAQVEHGDPVRDVAHDAEVVRDEEERDAALRLQLDEEVEDRRLHRDVERRGRLVADDELRRRPRTRARSRRAASARRRAATGFCVSVRSESRTLSVSSSIRFSAGAPLRPASFLSERRRIRRTEWRRFSAESGFWNTIWSARSSSVERCWKRGASAVPSSSTTPLDGSTIPSSARASVVLPLPDSPTRPSVSPAQISPETPASACTSWPCCLNTLPRSSKRTTGAAVRSTGRHREVAAPPRGGARWPGRGASSGPRGPLPTAVVGRLLGAAAVVGERAAVDEDAARELRTEARQEAGDRVEPSRGPSALRRAGCSAGARPCTGAAGRSAPPRPAPPRRAAPRRARRRGRTSSRSRRGCG